MTGRWVCNRCFTSAEPTAATCPNCGLARGAERPSAVDEVHAGDAETLGDGVASELSDQERYGDVRRGAKPAGPAAATRIGDFLRLYVLAWSVIGTLGFVVAFLAGGGSALPLLVGGIVWAFLGWQMFRVAGRYGIGPRSRLNLELAIPGVPTLLLFGTFLFVSLVLQGP